MNSISAKSKVNLIFILGISLLIVVGVFTYRTFLKQAEDSDWVTHTYQTINHLENSRHLLQKMHVAQRDRRINPLNKNSTKEFTLAHNQLEAQIKTLEQLMADNAAQTVHLSRIEDALQAILRFWSLPENSIHNLKTINDESTRISAIRSGIDKMISIEENLLKERQATQASAFRVAAITILISMAIAILIASLFIYLILAELKQRQATQKELSLKLDVVSKLNDEAEQKNWLLTGVSMINDSLHVTHNTESLTNTVINELVSYLNIQAASLYVVEGDKLLRKAAIGLPQNAPIEYLLGAGLIGKAAQRKHLQHLNQVPADFWRLEAGLGSALPGELVFVPLWVDHKLKGIIELASFQPFSEAALALLQTVEDNIAVALDASLIQEANNLLLTQVQEQKKVLEDQQNYLRETNEELTRQTEALQASEEEMRVQEEELRQVNAELEERNEAMESARQALASKARELEMTSKYKSEFLANMSHELRTPLNSVLILARLLADNKPGNLTEKQVEHARVIFKSGNDLLTLINDVLDLSKIEAGKVDVIQEEVYSAHILRNMQELFGALADEKSIQFQAIRGEVAPQSFASDQQRIEQIIKNLLSNAFKFTPAGGTIKFSIDLIRPRSGFFTHNLNEAREVLALSVQDSGIGIPAEKQQLIFEAFQQADGSTNRKYGGTGLGLSICKELAHLLGGEIRVESTVGKGSKFTLYLPSLAYKASTPVPVPEKEAELEQVTFPEHRTEQDVVHDDRDSIQSHDRSVLIVEDDPLFAHLLRDYVRTKGYKTIVAISGEEGLYYARKFFPSAILLDIQLPGISGWEVLKYLKSDALLKPIPVHIITSEDKPREVIEGAETYTNKASAHDTLNEVFTQFADEVPSNEKKLLILTENKTLENSIGKWLEERDYHIHTQFVTTLEEACSRLMNQDFHSILVDAGDSAEKSFQNLQSIQLARGTRRIPTILFMNQDLLPADEAKLKKVSDVIIRNSQLAKDRLLDELELFLFKVENPPVLPKAQAIIPEKALKGKKILVVDDDMRNVFSLSTLLEEHEMHVITAGDGRESLESLEDNPDTTLVLMDIMMPEMDGYEAMRHIRANKRFEKLPIIALTAKAMQGDREKCIEAGASDYITKPIDSKQLLSLIRVWLSQG
ncbi:response regulator [Siphonobacter sp. SORGH_AS_1065]|uniref:response regulator n=1 Tax=Siphonobacter sp. SORGH_AS_1065 TaxID=3041795 RepID=UPI00277FD7CF|nr:response regulator [Siphonobacter sp. SORGH_AS_1065]MDQ1088236.1 signal transduction histidine kinase/CheY-like chemotaxis protein/CHASE3 domain sensor protein [Siphonobacter sp. SORGH_AS_1065]